MMKRHKHNLSHFHNTTFDMGQLVPISCVEVLPGDTFRMRYDNSNDGFTLLVPSDPSNISGTVTLTNESISSVFGTLLDSGPVLVFRDDGISGATGANNNVVDGIFDGLSASTEGAGNTSVNGLLLAGGFTNYNAAATTSSHVPTSLRSSICSPWVEMRSRIKCVKSGI